MLGTLCTGTGSISTSFVEDILLSRDAPHAHHTIAKREAFVNKVFAKDTLVRQMPKICVSYEGVYGDPEVDIIYVGTPHASHKYNCLAAIDARKHIPGIKKKVLLSSKGAVIRPKEIRG
jgi:dihydrodiol dehydrogenase / D-xylose 1-dehydrogenase (NADP)